MPVLFHPLLEESFQKKIAGMLAIRPPNDMMATGLTWLLGSSSQPPGVDQAAISPLSASLLPRFAPLTTSDTSHSKEYF